MSNEKRCRGCLVRVECLNSKSLFALEVTSRGLWWLTSKLLTCATASYFRLKVRINFRLPNKLVCQAIHSSNANVSCMCFLNHCSMSLWRYHHPATP